MKRDKARSAQQCTEASVALRGRIGNSCGESLSIPVANTSVGLWDSGCAMVPTEGTCQQMPRRNLESPWVEICQSTVYAKTA